MLSYKHIKIYDAEGDLSKEWYVSFYFLKPVEHQKAGSSLYKRFKIFESINTFKTVRSRRNQIKVVYNSIKELLENGFNPFTQFKYSKITGKYSISQCIDEYLERVKPDLKPKSYKLYDGRLKLFKVFLEESNLGDMDISHLSKQHIFDFVKPISYKGNGAIKPIITTFRPLIHSYSTILITSMGISKKMYVLRSKNSRYRKGEIGHLEITHSKMF